MADNETRGLTVSRKIRDGVSYWKKGKTPIQTQKRS